MNKMILISCIYDALENKLLTSLHVWFITFLKLVNVPHVGYLVADVLKPCTTDFTMVRLDTQVAVHVTL